jgi:DNA-binding NtrC family response regulator
LRFGGFDVTAKRLLIVDDNKAFGEYIRKVANSAGYNVEVTSSGEAFKARYDVFKPTVVLVDLVMPDIDGIELVQWVATRNSPARVIVTTGYSPEYATLAKMLGEGRGLAPMITLIKPVKPDRLRCALTDFENDTGATSGNGRKRQADQTSSSEACDDLNPDY